MGLPPHCASVSPSGRTGARDRRPRAPGKGWGRTDCPGGAKCPRCGAHLRLVESRELALYHLAQRRDGLRIPRSPQCGGSHAAHLRQRVRQGVKQSRHGLRIRAPAQPGDGPQAHLVRAAAELNGELGGVGRGVTERSRRYGRPGLRGRFGSEG
jgi:hypothetical protein